MEASVTMERDCENRAMQCHGARKGRPSGGVMPHTANTGQEGLQYTTGSHTGPRMMLMSPRGHEWYQDGLRIP